MQVNLNQFSSALSQAASLFNQRIAPHLSTQNQKVILAVAVVFGTLGTYCLTQLCKSPLTVDKLLKKSSKGKDLGKENKIALILKEDYNNELGFKMSLMEKINMAKAGGETVTALNFKGSNITDKQLQEVIAHCPSLKELKLENCKHLTGVMLKDLKKLEVLSLAGCSKLNDQALKNLPDSLVKLDLSHCTQLKDEHISSLPSQSLTSLNLSYCAKITNKGAAEVSKKLHELKLAYCTNLTDSVLKVLPNAIGVIDLTGCSKLTHDCLKAGIIHWFPKE